MKGIESDYSENVMADPTSSLAILGHRYYLHGMYAESAKLFEFVLRHEPTCSEHYYALGKALHALKKHDQAINAYMRAIRLGQADAELHFHLGQCLLFLDRLDEAGHSFETCLRMPGLQHHNASYLKQKAKQLLLLVHRHKKKLGGQKEALKTELVSLSSPQI